MFLNVFNQIYDGIMVACEVLFKPIGERDFGQLHICGPVRFGGGCDTCYPIKNPQHHDHRKKDRTSVVAGGNRLISKQIIGFPNWPNAARLWKCVTIMDKFQTRIAGYAQAALAQAQTEQHVIAI